jgi:probable phosphoglycerate mutase
MWTSTLTRAQLTATGCLYDLTDRHPGDRIPVVAHSTAIRLALCELIGVPLRDYRRIFPSLRNCGLTEIRLTADREVALWRAVSSGVRPASDAVRRRPRSSGSRSGSRGR